jgi:hypothetical protein
VTKAIKKKVPGADDDEDADSEAPEPEEKLDPKDGLHSQEDFENYIKKILTLDDATVGVKTEKITELFELKLFKEKGKLELALKKQEAKMEKQILRTEEIKKQQNHKV